MMNLMDGQEKVFVILKMSILLINMKQSIQKRVSLKPSKLLGVDLFRKQVGKEKKNIGIHLKLNAS